LISTSSYGSTKPTIPRGGRAAGSLIPSGLWRGGGGGGGGPPPPGTLVPLRRPDHGAADRKDQPSKANAPAQGDFCGLLSGGRIPFGAALRTRRPCPLPPTDGNHDASSRAQRRAVTRRAVSARSGPFLDESPPKILGLSFPGLPFGAFPFLSIPFCRMGPVSLLVLATRLLPLP